VTLVLDAGALVALERRHPAVWSLVKSRRISQGAPITHGGVVGQVWRGGGARQAGLERALAGVQVRPLDHALGKRAGGLLALTGGREVIDAAVVLLCRDGDDIVTSDPDDITTLAAAAGVHVEVVPV
jgi:hypothetical protein